MLLTCPNCGAEYEVAEGMIPPAGRHVQCSACHTRWFVAGRQRAMLTEEEVLHRLETWSPKPIPIAPDPDEEPDLDDDDAPTAAAAPAPAPVAPIRRAAAPAKPGETPAARPAPIPGTPAPTRQALRLDVGATLAPPPPRRSRYGWGLAAALLLAAVAFVAYLRHAELAADLPAAAPALAAYGDAVDALREELDADVVEPLRHALGDG